MFHSATESVGRFTRSYWNDSSHRSSVLSADPDAFGHVQITSLAADQHSSQSVTVIDY